MGMLTASIRYQTWPVRDNVENRPENTLIKIDYYGHPNLAVLGIVSGLLDVAKSDSVVKIQLNSPLNPKTGFRVYNNLNVKTKFYLNNKLVIPKSGSSIRHQTRLVSDDFKIRPETTLKKVTQRSHPTLAVLGIVSSYIDPSEHESGVRFVI
jgi:hypothetical protein